MARLQEVEELGGIPRGEYPLAAPILLSDARGDGTLALLGREPFEQPMGRQRNLSVRYLPSRLPCHSVDPFAAGTFPRA
jgi:hypothetical protein